MDSIVLAGLVVFLFGFLVFLVGIVIPWWILPKKTKTQSEFHVGDIVIPKGDTRLRSGCEEYFFAVVVQTDPLVLVSEYADMKWEATVKDMQLKVIGKASPEIFERCSTRLWR